MKRYCMGFLFNKSRTKVLLILKDRPEWQKGRYNGIGGKLLDGEDALMGQVREFYEETGLPTSLNFWKEYVIIKDLVGNYEFFIYKAILGSETVPRMYNPDHLEPISWHDVVSLPRNCIYNLNWLIPLAFDETLKLPIQLVSTREAH